MDNLGFSDNLDQQTQRRIQISATWKNDRKIHTFDEAAVLTGNGKFQISLLIVCGLCLMSVMTEIMGISLLIPVAKCDLEIDLREQGFLASAGFLGIVTSSHAMGFLSDTWGRLKVLKTSITAGVICSVISAFSYNIWMLICLRFVVGFFISSCQACVYTYLGEFHGSKTRTKSVTLLSTFLPTALAYMPAVAYLVLPLDLGWCIFNMKFSSWRLFILANTIPGLFALLILPFFPESPRYLLIQGKQEEAINVLKMVYAKNKGVSGDEYPVKEISIDIVGSNLNSVRTVKDGLKLMWNQTTPLFYKELRWHTLNFTLHIFIIFGISQGVFMWFPGILNTMVDNYYTDTTVCDTVFGDFFQNKTEGSIDIEDDCSVGVDVFMYKVLIMMGLAYTIVYLFFTFTIDIIGKKRLLITWMILAGSCGIALYWSTGFYLNIVLLTLFMAIGNCAGIVNTLSMEFFPTNINAMGMCLLLMIGRLGASAGSNIIGLVLSYSCDMLFYGASILIFLLVSFSILLPENRQ